jgi:phosphocarrier protein HPr
MITIKYTIKDPEGIHARPAGEMVKLLKAFASTITISKGEQTVDAKRILGVMGLAAKQGQEIIMAVEGADEEKAAQEIELFLNEKM